MEDLEPITDADQAAFCVELAKRLNMLRRQDCLCDITLVTKDDKEFKAHRNILSATSPFFCKLLQSDMKENREGIVRFEEISGAVMEDVLEFVYTGSVEITQENCKDLFAAANYLLIPGFKKTFWAISGTRNIQIKLHFNILFRGEIPVRRTDHQHEKVHPRELSICGRNGRILKLGSGRS